MALAFGMITKHILRHVQIFYLVKTRDRLVFICFSMGSGPRCFGNIVNRSCEYDELVGALEERFAPPNQTEFYHVQLRERNQKTSELLSELVKISDVLQI